MPLAVTITRNRDHLRRKSLGGRFRFVVDSRDRRIFQAVGASVDALRARAESSLGVSLANAMPTIFAHERRHLARIVIADEGERAALREMLYLLLEVGGDRVQAALEPAFGALEAREPAALVQVPRKIADALRGLLVAAAGRPPTDAEAFRGVTPGAYARLAGRL